MRYRATAIVAATALAVLGYNGLDGQQPKVPNLAYVNTDAIIAQAPGAAEAQATFEREMARWQSEIQAMSDSLDAMISSFEQQQVMLSPERRQERQRTIELKRMEYQQRTLDLEQVARQRQQELIQPVLDRITRVLDAIREERDYSMIFDFASGALFTADTTLDITPLVIERLRASAAAGGPSN